MKFDTAWPTSTEEGYVGEGTGRTALSYRWPCVTNAANSIGQNSSSPSVNVYWTDITAGLWDSTITAAANRLAAYGEPIFVGFSGEFDSTANAINTVGTETRATSSPPTSTSGTSSPRSRPT